MDFALNKEQLMIQQMVREFALNEIEPVASEYEAEGRFPEEIIKGLSDLGIMGMTVPKEYGGGGCDTVSYTVAIEEIARACASTAIAVSVNNSLACFPLLTFGTEEQKQEHLVPIASGQTIGAFGLTEPSAGSDAAMQQTVAEADGDGYVLNGVKHFITNATVADVYIVFAMEDRTKGTRGITTFILRKGDPGFTFGTIEDKLGIRASIQAELVFEDCHIAAERRLGDSGKGFKIAMMTLDVGRIGVASQALGIAQACLDRSVQFANEREQFGKPIGRLGAIQEIVANMATQIEASRMLVRYAAWCKDNGRPFSKEAAMAKLHASETAMQVATKAIQVHGGYGYIKDYPVERYFRDAKITEIYEGTSEIQRLVIALNVLAGK
ncbi:MAG: acyl-CoA dehydrogenase [Thermoplasmata archaeon]|nr:acyl-CoA dehydrogenase [Thermoplasmata archaeon]MCK5414314.1 acyl-CoA dehydrogenase [Thermoplasmata archaeon]